MTIQTVPLSSLLPPAANPRTVVDAEALEGLATSIRCDGLLQNLVVQATKGMNYRIISGERRYRALKLLEERGEIAGDYDVPVDVRTKVSRDDTLRLATVENLQRQNLPPLDEAKALAALIRKGTTLEDLSSQTGLSATTIRRRLASNGLCDEARAALSEDRISFSQAEALTLGGHEAQRDLLQGAAGTLEHLRATDIRGYFLDRKPTVAMAIFPLDRYVGSITTDLFGEAEETYFDDMEQFRSLQAEAVKRLAADYAAKASWVEVTDAYRFPEWQYEPAEDGEPSGVVINLSPLGRVDIREGLARPEIDPATRSATADNPAAPKKPRAAYPTSLRRYIAWHKSLAVQEMLLASPRKAKEIAVACGLHHLKLHEGIYKLAEEEQGQAAYGVMESQARIYAGKLGFDIDPETPVWLEFPPIALDDRALYEAVKALSDHDLDGLHTLLTALQFGQANCEALDTADSLFNRVAQDLGVRMRDHWHPDRAFLERRTRDQLIGIAQASGCAETMGDLGSSKKSGLVECLLRRFERAHAATKPTSEQRKACEWLPEAMRFPAVDPDAAVARAEDEAATDD